MQFAVEQQRKMIPVFSDIKGEDGKFLITEFKPNLVNVGFVEAEEIRDAKNQLVRTAPQEALRLAKQMLCFKIGKGGGRFPVVYNAEIAETARRQDFAQQMQYHTSFGNA